MFIESVLAICLTIGATDVQVGDQVVTRTHTSVMSGSKKLAEVSSGERLVVNRLNGSWARVTVIQSGESISGWIKITDFDVTHRGSSSAAAFASAAEAMLGAGKYAEAIADCDQAIELDPDYWQAHYCRAYALSLQQESDRAIAGLTEVIRLYPEFAPAYCLRGQVRRNLSQWDLALADLDQAVRINPNYADAYDSRGQVWVGKNEYETGIADYDMAIRLSPNHANALANRGAAYRLIGQASRAIADTNMAIRLRPDNAFAYVNRAHAWAHQGDRQRAIADLEKSLEIEPKSFWHQYELGMFKRAAGDRTGAEDAFAAARRIYPQLGETWYFGAVRWGETAFADANEMTFEVQAPGQGVLRAEHEFASRTTDGDDSKRMVEEKQTMYLGAVTVVLARTANSEEPWRMEVDGQERGLVRPGDAVQINKSRQVIVNGATIGQAQTRDVSVAP